MSTRPIFVATHPRSCSTAFERVFMTRKDTLACVHEPFGDAFYWGPERLSERFENDEAAREKSGFANTTYKNVLDQIYESGRDGKRIFIKDITYYLLPPDGKPSKIAPSLATTATEPGAGEEANPTVIPTETLKKFHFTFLIRHPRKAIPSYYRCTIPPLDKVTGFYHFMPSEAGYLELRRLFDYLRATKIIGPVKPGEKKENGTSTTNGNTNGVHGEGEEVAITVVDADDLLDKPDQVIEAYCREVGIDFTPEMLSWDGEDAQKQAEEAFEKWSGFHNDAIGSSSLKPRGLHKTPPSIEAENEEWKAKFGEEAQKVIRETVDANVADYEYLKSFAIKV